MQFCFDHVAAVSCAKTVQLMLFGMFTRVRLEPWRECHLCRVAGNTV